MGEWCVCEREGVGVEKVAVTITHRSKQRGEHTLSSMPTEFMGLREYE